MPVEPGHRTNVRKGRASGFASHNVARSELSLDARLYNLMQDPGALRTDSPFDRLGDAAVEELLEQGVLDVKFSAICERAGISKATGYRYFPTGTEGVLDYLHRATLAEVIAAIRLRTAELSDEVAFETAVEAGVRGVVTALRTAPWTAKVLRRSLDWMTAYLLSREEGRILPVLSNYAARCAVNFGSGVDDVRRHSTRFVWDVFSDLLGEFPAPGDDTTVWPDPDGEVMDHVLSGPVREFVAAVQLNGVTKDGLAVPVATLPMRFGRRMPVALITRA
jgi:AcrR family transcriptional regulator